MGQCLRSTGAHRSLRACLLHSRAQELPDVLELLRARILRKPRRPATRQEDNCVSNLIFFARSTPHPRISRSQLWPPRRTTMPDCFDWSRFQLKLVAAERLLTAPLSARIGSSGPGAFPARLQAVVWPPPTRPGPPPACGISRLLQLKPGIP